MSARIKICGLRDADTIRAMNGLSIHEIGFVFAKSRRQVSPALAAQLAAEAGRISGADGDAPRTVGVFVNPSLAELRALLAEVRLDIVQLHGDEPPELCRAAREELGVRVWKVFAMRDEADGADGDAQARVGRYAGAVDGVMIDTAGGGTGATFDWNAIAAYKRAAAGIGAPLYVAGGLHADNVASLLRTHAPDGVDVSSGVETDGVKDIGKIKRFVERVAQQNEPSA